MAIGSPRRYDNSGRRAASEATRRRVIVAAGQAFTDKGYASTTLAAIAERADVSVETIKKHFRTKRELLVAWFDAAVAGDEAVAVADSSWVAELGGADTLDERIAITASAITDTHRRAAMAHTVVAAGAHADPDIQAWWADERARRRQDVEMIVPAVLGEVAPALPHDQLVDAAYAISEAHTYHVLTHELGWPDDRYRRWLAGQIHDLIASTIFDDDTPRGGTP